MKADRIGSDRIISLPHLYTYFLSDVERSGYYTDAVTDAVFSDAGYGEESDRLRSGCRLI
jgi:hypothetical protein